MVRFLRVYLPADHDIKRWWMYCRSADGLDLSGYFTSNKRQRKKLSCDALFLYLMVTKSAESKRILVIFTVSCALPGVFFC